MKQLNIPHNNTSTLPRLDELDADESNAGSEALGLRTAGSFIAPLKNDMMDNR